MIVSAMLAFLAALGVVLLVWVLVGVLLLPANGNGYTVLFAKETDVRNIQACLFLLRAGLSRLPLYVVDCGLREEECRWLRSMEQRGEWIHLYSPAEWIQFRETERENGVLGTGRDSAGDSERDCLPEF